MTCQEIEKLGTCDQFINFFAEEKWYGALHPRYARKRSIFQVH